MARRMMMIYVCRNLSIDVDLLYYVLFIVKKCTIPIIIIGLLFNYNFNSRMTAMNPTIGCSAYCSVS